MNQQQGSSNSRRVLLKKKNAVKFCSKTDFIGDHEDSSFEGQNLKKFHKANRDGRLLGSKTERRGFLRRVQTDQEIKRILKEIQPRAASFFKLGFNSLEKGNKERKLFADFFNLHHQGIKGTMSSGEFWSSKDRAHYFKENNVFLNKVKLFEKISSMKKGDRVRSRTASSIKNGLESNGSLGYSDTSSQIPTAKTIRENDKDFVHSINGMRRNLADLHRSGNSGKRMNHIIRDLEVQSKTLQRMEKNYFVKLIEMF